MSSAWTRQPPEERKFLWWGISPDKDDVEPSKIHHYCSIDMDLDTKLAALKACLSIVSLVSYTGKKEKQKKEELFVCSGTIIECEESNGTFCGTILTSACLIRCPSGEATVARDIRVAVYLSDGKLLQGQVGAFDFHYNIATIKIKSDAPLPTAILRHFEDSMLVNPSVRPGPGDMVVDSSSFQLPRHVDKAVDSNIFKLCPGERVVALGLRYPSNKLTAQSGEFSVGCCDYDCKELVMASCRMTKNAIGGPLINRYGEVIGINFYHKDYTPFLPINIVSKCLEDLKKHRRIRRPWLGVEVSNLYVARVDKLEVMVKKFPSISKGVIVEKVISKSPADRAGIHPDDVIIQCDEHNVGCFLEFFGIMWDKAGKSVEVIVMRASTGTYEYLTMDVDETSPDNYYKWPVPKETEHSFHIFERS